MVRNGLWSLLAHYQSQGGEVMFGKKKYIRKDDEVSWFLTGELPQLMSMMSSARNAETLESAKSAFFVMIGKSLYRNVVFYSPVWMDEEKVTETLLLASQFTQNWIDNDFMLTDNFVQYSATVMGGYQALLKAIDPPYTLKEKEQFWIGMVESGLIEMSDVREEWNKKQNANG